MNIRFLAPFLIALLGAYSVPSYAQQAGKVYRVGRLSGGACTANFGGDSIKREPRQLGMQLRSMAIDSPDKYESTFKEAVKAGSTALAVVRHRLVQSGVYQKQIIERVAKYSLPTIYYREDFVKQGGLMSYGADELDPSKRVAAMVDKILKGAKPADIPVEQSSKFEFGINFKTAKQLGLSIPPEILARADRVIR
jgi:putative tryptophan/tyrosine transport system substrate-binding protein